MRGLPLTLGCGRARRATRDGVWRLAGVALVCVFMALSVSRTLAITQVTNTTAGRGPLGFLFDQHHPFSTYLVNL